MRTKGEAVSEVVGFLAGIPLFSKLSEPSCVLLACESRFKSIEKGEVLFFQHDPSEAAYLVRTGNVSIVLNSSDGREMVINDREGLSDNGIILQDLGEVIFKGKQQPIRVFSVRN